MIQNLITQSITLICSVLHIDLITLCASVLGLLTVSEVLPFVKRLESNGNVQLVINIIKKLGTK